MLAAWTEARAAARSACGSTGAQELDGGPAIMLPAEDIEIFVATLYVSPLREELVPTDISSWTFAASAEGSTEPPVVGSGGVDGRARISAAPGGARVILIGRDTLTPVAVVGTSTRIELVSVVGGRSGPDAQTGSEIELSMHGLSPWTEDDTVEVFSPASGYVRFDAQHDAPQLPAAGAQSVAGMIMPYTGYPLLSSLPADDLYAAHYVGEALRDHGVAQVAAVTLVR